jgi:anti-sigma regulatory factor (Ser/Thr protein kinase)
MAVQTPGMMAGTGEHIVQFYDDERGLARSVGSYLAQAIRARETGIVIATPEHRAAFETELVAAGADGAGAEREGRLIWLDAADTLSRFMPSGRVDPDLFQHAIGELMGEASRAGRPINAYGEMVALLWDRGDVLGAIELEKLWNALAREYVFSLWCAYHGHSLAPHEHADELHEVCHLHTSVTAEATARFAAGVDAPLAARRFVTSLLGRRPYLGLVTPEAAQLVVSELATNAVIHAGTPFSVTVALNGSAIRISVRDWNGTPPILRSPRPASRSGRGLLLVDAIAHDWGVEDDPEGKIVWADLPLREVA